MSKNVTVLISTFPVVMASPVIVVAPARAVTIVDPGLIAKPCTVNPKFVAVTQLSPSVLF